MRKDNAAIIPAACPESRYILRNGTPPGLLGLRKKSGVWAGYMPENLSGKLFFLASMHPDPYGIPAGASGFISFSALRLSLLSPAFVPLRGKDQPADNNRNNPGITVRNGSLLL